MTEQCTICHQETVPVEVHGHIQCDKCGQNYSPCCQGEQENGFETSESDSTSE